MKRLTITMLLMLSACGYNDYNCDGFCTLDGAEISAHQVYNGGDYDIYVQDCYSVDIQPIVFILPYVRKTLDDKFSASIDKLTIVFVDQDIDQVGWYLYCQPHTIYINRSGMDDVVFAHEYTHLLQLSVGDNRVERVREGEACAAEKFIFGWSRFDGYLVIDRPFDGSIEGYISAYQYYIATYPDFLNLPIDN